jgi:antibiotic biosynthesis monooxygenase (ABM) superfamily enzyme
MTPRRSSRTAAGSGREPIKVVMERQVHLGAETRFEGWLRTLLDTAGDFGGLEGSSVLTAGTSGHYFTLLRFASAERMQQWQDSPQLAALVREANTFSVAADAAPIKTGLETWFTLPGLLGPRGAPPKWKMALVTWVALPPQVIILAFALAPLRLSFLLDAALSTAIPVVMLTWVVMPGLTRLLYAWPYAGHEVTT